MKKFALNFDKITVTQSSADVSVVKLDKTQGDGENGGITITVDPPRPTRKVSSEATTTTTTTATTTSTTTTTEGTAIVDPFMEMDPEQLERLETALQSEEAKQILGENVTAMLGKTLVDFFLLMCCWCLRGMHFYCQFSKMCKLIFNFGSFLFRYAYCGGKAKFIETQHRVGSLLHE